MAFCYQVKYIVYNSVFLGAVAIYLPVSIAGFVVLGDYMVYANILKNMTPNWILYTVIILINFHFLLGFIIVVNPLLQDLEAILKIENSEYLL